MAARLSALRTGRFLPPGRFLVLISVRGWVDPRATVRLEGSGKLKNPPHLGFEPATFWLVAQCLNQLCYRVPRCTRGYLQIQSKQCSSNNDLHWTILQYMYKIFTYKDKNKKTEIINRSSSSYLQYNNQFYVVSVYMLDQVTQSQHHHSSKQPTISCNIYLSLNSPCGPWLLFQFLNPYTVGRTPWMVDQPIIRPLSTQTATQTQNKST
jgi:hypothetical protein